MSVVKSGTQRSQNKSMRSAMNRTALVQETLGEFYC
jgi:hypothetical protein